MNVTIYLSSDSSFATSTAQFDLGGGFHPKYEPICDINLARSGSDICSSPALDPGENPNWVTQFLNIGQSNVEVIPLIPRSPYLEISFNILYANVSKIFESAIIFLPSEQIVTV